uniref:Ovule protein n=1 Tax=Syphacia muris TaxID=451379 RepID=A0A0N5AUD0_9BILA
MLTYCSAEACPLMDFVKSLSEKINNDGKLRKEKGSSPLKELSEKLMKMLNNKKKREAVWPADHDTNHPEYALTPSKGTPI